MTKEELRAEIQGRMPFLVKSKLRTSKIEGCVGVFKTAHAAEQVVNHLTDSLYVHFENIPLSSKEK